MSVSPILHFEFSPDENPERLNDGWGRGTLLLDGKPYWFCNSEATPLPVEWTWVDFLEHIADVWGALVSEQFYPFGWLRHAAHPGELWTVADRRWARLGDAVADREEPALIAFDRRHNLAAAWKGLGLPALTWLRVGKTLWLSPEEGEPIRAPFPECLNALVKFGNQLADAYANTRNARVAAAVTAWRNRGAVFRSQFVELATGLTQDQIQAIQGDQDASAYWDIAANTDWNSGQVFEGPLLAAARMTAGILDTPSIKRVVGSIRGLKKHRSDELDNLAAKATTFLAGKQARFAFEAGYLVADFFRTGCLELTRKYVDIENLLRRLNVELLEIDFGATRIDAVALWGGRGPCIAMNSAREFAFDSKRTRMTWAHELCHLLVDRKGGLPFCEVLGGQVDDFIERRANAFAAELLLPRASVEHEWSLWTNTFSEFLLMLSHEYGVSKSVACAQIHNSLAFEKLDQTAQTYVIGRLQHFEKGEQDDTIRTAEGVV